MTGSIVNSTAAPETGLPESTALNFSKNCEELCPERQELSAASTPVAPLNTEK
jgi:hypothetical protein